MASQATHALIVVEVSNTLSCVAQSNRKSMLVLLALWMFLVAASSSQDAVDRLARVPSQPPGLASHDELLRANGPGSARARSRALRSARARSRALRPARFDELGKTAHDPAYYQTHHEAPALCELGAPEPEDTEEDGRLDALTVGFAAYFARLLPFVDRTRSLAATVWQAQFLAASALPRGPPSIGC